MKKLLTTLLILTLILGALPALAQAPGYEAVLSAANPVPAIAKAVRPAVVQVVASQVEWSKATGAVSYPVSGGSGVYVDERGYIITNNHIVEGADELEVVLLDGTKLKAELVGADDGIDIAVLKVEGDMGVAPVPLGDSDALEIGELAIVIGNPGSGTGSVLTGTVTVGVISALNREHVTAGTFTRAVKVIQIDAAINTGNSGGALLNHKGELIGIPTLKMMFDMTTVYEGLGFAVPVNTIKPVFEQLVAKGYVTRPRLGVTVVTVEGPDQPLRNYAPMGAQVIEVEMGGPAAQAGVQRGDVIMALEGVRVEGTDHLVSLLDDYDFGQRVTVDVCRYFDPMTGEPLRKWEMLSLQVTLSKE